MKTIKTFEFEPKLVRRTLGLNQQDFWGRIGVAQSCGSRYETGRRMPKPVQELLRVVHIERIDLTKVNARELAILDYLKTHEFDNYVRLSKLAGSARTQEPHLVQSGQNSEPDDEIAGLELSATEFLKGWVQHCVGNPGLELSPETQSPADYPLMLE